MVYAGKKRVYARKPQVFAKKKKTTHTPELMEVAAFGLPRTLGTLPTVVKCSFKYGDIYNIASGATGVSNAHVFSCNGLYDPDITGVGHQPRGFDQIMALYDHYTVIASKIKVQYWIRPAQTGQAAVGISVQDDNTVFTDYRDYMESPNNVTIQLSPDGDRSKTLVSQINPNKFLGRSKPLADSQLKGSSTGNPTEQCYFHVWVTSSTEATSVDAVVEIEYTAIMGEPRLAPIS